ncbi:hypothetical protein IWW36_004090 [Coemansia brasiliensis]|uniref:Sphingomyelin synthase-like domain-containing protein n=1 Tax=Coemansia brasiliensis TaxID=2650707 RepID=A0A9W8LXX7_9FUNG|nr:hypothetical protein IWW36_004090 [Coemansia brasiliensis]
MATLYLLRSITISVTTLPPSIVNCTPKVAHNREEWASIIPQMISGQVSGCTDKLFSGHTCLLFISFLIWTRYARHWIFIVYSFVHTTLGIATVLAVRLHYTVDVILAIVLTFLAHQFYYTMLELAVQKQAPTVLRASQDSKGYNQVPLCNDQDLAGRDGLEFDKRNSESIALDIFPSSGSVVAENAENRLESHWATHVLSCTHSSYNSIGPETMLVNRMPLTILPNIVAWMDGWHLR